MTQDKNPAENRMGCYIDELLIRPGRDGSLPWNPVYDLPLRLEKIERSE